MRGFVITILSLSLIMVLVLLIISLQNAQLSTERTLIDPLPLLYASSFSDNVAHQLNSVVGPNISINEGNSSVILSINDTLQSYNYASDIQSFQTFVTNAVAPSSASMVSMNFTNLTSGLISMTIDGDYNYMNNHTSNETTFTRVGGTNVTAYSINFTTIATRSSLSQISQNSSGPINVMIEYTDLNGTGIDHANVTPTITNSFTVSYADGSSILITIGPNNGNPGSLSIESIGRSSNIEWEATLPQINQSEKIGYAYNASINYTQGNVGMYRQIED